MSTHTVTYSVTGMRSHRALDDGLFIDDLLLRVAATPA